MPYLRLFSNEVSVLLLSMASTPLRTRDTCGDADWRKRVSLAAFTCVYDVYDELYVAFTRLRFTVYAFTILCVYDDTLSHLQCTRCQLGMDGHASTEVGQVTIGL